jgi:hypothetical protein
MRSKLLTALVVAMVATSAVVGVVGSASTAAPAAKFTGAPIKIGVTYVCNASQPPAVCEVAPSIQAAVKAANAAGGAKTADGKTHELSVVVCNNENDRTKTADCGRQFASAGVAYATGAAVYGDEILPILEQAGIAYLNPTPLGTGTAEGTASNSFLLSNTLGLFTALVEQLAQGGKKNISIVAQGAGAAIAGLTKSVAQKNGATTSLVQVDQTNPNWAQAAEQASSGDVVMLVVDKYGSKAFLDAYTQAGKTTTVTSVIGIITDASITATGGAKSPLVGGSVTGYFPPPRDKAWADYRAAMKKYAPKTVLEPASQSMYLSVQLGNAILATVNGDVTAKAFLDAANNMTDVPTFGGKLPSGLSFQKGGTGFPGPRLFNPDYWGPLKSTAKGVVNGKGATYQEVPPLS